MKSIPNLDTNNVIPVYGNNATGYLEPPTDLQREKGVIPLDSLPADWWNWLWNNTTKNLNSACLDINALYSEIIAVLAAAGISPQENSTVELKNAIVALTKVVATATTPGAIKSSSNAGQVSINAEGLGTVNCLGSPTSLATTNKTIVGAINELNTALSTLTGTTLPNTYAPISHASAGTTYGVASASQYGHIKVTTGNGLSISNGVLSMGNAVISTTTYPGACCTGTVTAVCYNGTKYNPTSGVVNLGNAPTGFPGYYTGNGSAPGTASAGTSTLVSRGDHAHPFPWTGCCRIAIGCNATIPAAASHSIAIGEIAESRGNYSVSIGDSSLAYGYGIAIGHAVFAHTCGTAVGVNSSACTCGTAIGYCACAKCTGDVSIGACTLTNLTIPVNLGNRLFVMNVACIGAPVPQCELYKQFKEVVGNAYEKVTGHTFSDGDGVITRFTGVYNSAPVEGIIRVTTYRLYICCYKSYNCTQLALMTEAWCTCTAAISGYKTGYVLFPLPDRVEEAH